MGHSSSKGKRRAWERVQRGIGVEGVERGDASDTAGLDVARDGTPDDALDDALGDDRVLAAVGLRISLDVVVRAGRLPRRPDAVLETREDANDGTMLADTRDIWEVDRGRFSLAT